MTRYTRYEVARIIGARSLQISLGAPILVPSSDPSNEPLDIAFAEYEKDAIPITVRRG
ncbi:MAG: DNA-directed RNA polymerase subunit K [Thermoplasmata archaeon]